MSKENIQAQKQKTGEAAASPAFLILIVILQLLDSNHSATVVLRRSQRIYATSSNDSDVRAANAEVNELVSNSVSTALRQILVEFCATSVAIQ